MAYADGELDPLAAARVARAIAADPALAERVAAQRALRVQLAQAFAPIAESAVPERLRAMLTPNVVPLRRAAQPPPRRRWIEAAAIAASLAVGVAVGQQWRSGPVAMSRGAMIAAGSLAKALDTKLAGDRAGATRMLVSFRDMTGRYCRVFAAPSLDGIACRDAGDWTLRRTRSPVATPDTQFRQAGSGDGDLLAAAQDMMAGAPLDAAGEKAARDRGWTPPAPGSPR